MIDAPKNTKIETADFRKSSKIAGVLLALACASSTYASAETFLPMQDITVSGKVVVPSCKVRLDTETLSFDKASGAESTLLRQNLILSECEVEGVGVRFNADTWPEYPARGVLKSKGAKHPSEAWHFRVAPAMQDEPGASAAAWPLSAVTGARVLEGDTPAEGNPQGQYFSLEGADYWYDVKHSLQGTEVLTIPFLVTVHRTPICAYDGGSDLEAVFSLQLTYR